jgi:hypothetical protein
MVIMPFPIKHPTIKLGAQITNIQPKKAITLRHGSESRHCLWLATFAFFGRPLYAFIISLFNILMRSF